MKKIKIFVGVFLCMNLFTISGCDKVIHSAVVEEKDKTDSKTEEHKEKETVQKTVTEQVQAPKTYQTTIQSDLRSAERTDQENPMKFTLTADAPIEVPDVGAICLKNVKKMTISEEEPQKVLDTFAKGQLLKQDYDGLVSDDKRKTIKDERWNCISRAEISTKNYSLDLGLIADSTLTNSEDLGEPIDIAKDALLELETITKQLNAMIKELN